MFQSPVVLALTFDSTWRNKYVHIFIRYGKRHRATWHHWTSADFLKNTLTGARLKIEDSPLLYYSESRNFDFEDVRTVDNQYATI